MANNIETQVVSIMKRVGHDCALVLTDIEPYLPAAAAIATVIFPGDAVLIAATVTIVKLVEGAVVVTEQKYAATNNEKGTGPRKLADVVSIVSPIVDETLTLKKITLPISVPAMVSAVVGVLNSNMTTLGGSSDVPDQDADVDTLLGN